MSLKVLGRNGEKSLLGHETVYQMEDRFLQLKPITECLANGAIAGWNSQRYVSTRLLTDDGCIADISRRPCRASSLVYVQT